MKYGNNPSPTAAALMTHGQMTSDVVRRKRRRITHFLIQLCKGWIWCKIISDDFLSLNPIHLKNWKTFKRVWLFSVFKSFLVIKLINFDILNLKLLNLFGLSYTFFTKQSWQHWQLIWQMIFTWHLSDNRTCWENIYINATCNQKWELMPDWYTFKF